MKVIYPLNNIEIRSPSNISIFLAGTIDNGKAYDWQQEVIDKLNNLTIKVSNGTMPLDVDIYNPRPKDWDWNEEQSIDNSKFVKQIQWQIKAMEQADFIFLHFESNAQSPSSLVELGLFAKSNRLYVHCPDGFWRKGYVDIICNELKTNIVSSIDEFIEMIHKHAQMISVLR